MMTTTMTRMQACYSGKSNDDVLSNMINKVLQDFVLETS